VTVASIAGASIPEGTREVQSFGDRLAERVASRESQLVLGLDPDPMRLWPDAVRAAASEPEGSEPPAAEGPGAGGLGAEDSPADDSPAEGSPAEDSPADGSGADDSGAEGFSADTPAARAARAVAAHCARVIDAAGEYCVAAKLQLACFERLGAPGWGALADTVALARRHGLLVIADAKRGDIGVTATAYAQAFLGETPSPYGPLPGLGVDAMTVNPLLGRDSLEPFVATARLHGRGLLVLVRTSNPGAADIQERQLETGGAVSDRLAQLVNAIGSEGIGTSGLSDIGAVVGATAPGRLSALRERMPHAVFLLPGVGAQGGRVEDLAPAFAPGPAGGLVAASRGIVAAHEQGGGDPATAAAREARRLRDLAWRLTA
jgi:orotidine-5'-phosphate decarboxylase